NLLLAHRNPGHSPGGGDGELLNVVMNSNVMRREVHQPHDRPEDVAVAFIEGADPATVLAQVSRIDNVRRHRERVVSHTNNLTNSNAEASQVIHFSTSSFAGFAPGIVLCRAGRCPAPEGEGRGIVG